MYLQHHSSRDLSYLREPCGRLTGDSGFTIIELVVVVAIIAILAAVSGPLVTQWNRNKELSGTARNLFSNMQQAKLQAIRNNCDVVVDDGPLGRSYTVFLDNGGPTEEDGPGSGTLEGTETVVVQASAPADVMIFIPGTDFGSKGYAGYNSRALPLGGRTGSIVVRRAGLTDRWYRVRMTASGQLILEKSTDSTDGSDGNWN